MKKSVDLIHDVHFKKVFLNNIKPIEEEQEPEEDNYTSLSRIYTLSLLKDSQGNPISINEPNAAIIKRKKALKQKQLFKINKTEDDSKNVIPNTKNTWVKKAKIKQINNFKHSHFVKKFFDENYEINISKENNSEQQKEMEEIKEIKDSVICYICLMKVTSPKMCPNCHRIACEKCLKSWFITKNNKSCGYCRAVMTFDKRKMKINRKLKNAPQISIIKESDESFFSSETSKQIFKEFVK